MSKPITKKKALSLYDGNQAALARALGVSRQAVNKTEDGPLPELWQMKLRYELHPEAWGTEQKAA